MSAPSSQKKRKKVSKLASPAAPARPSTSALSSPSVAAPAARAPPLSAIAARRAAAAALAAASRPPTPPPAPVEEALDELDLQEDEDRRAQELIADVAADADDGYGGPASSAADHVPFDDEDGSIESDGGSSDDEAEDVTLQMDGEVISLGAAPRPSKSRRQAKPPKGKAREARISKLDAPDAEGEDVNGGGQYEMEVDTPQRSAYGASTSGTPSVAEGRVPKKRKGYQSGSSYQGAMSAFLPAPGHNILRLDAERLKDVFNDVQGGETACLVLLQSDETIVFSGSCAIYPLLSSVSVFGAVLPPTTSSPPTGHPIYAPTSHPLPVVAPSYGTAPPSPYLSLLGIEPERLAACACAFLVRERRSGLEGMYRAVGGLFDGVWDGDTAGWGVRGFYPALSQTSFTAYTVPPTWEAALSSAVPLPSDVPPPPPPTRSTFEVVPDSPASSADSLPSPSSEAEEDSYTPFTALLKGPKRSGKSGMSRALVNRLLRKYKKVAYLETDLGQSEFGPEGVVSLVVLEQPLLGPSFTHPAIPFRAHYYGSSTPRNDPSRYLALVSDLLSAYRLSVQYPPYASTHGVFRGASAADEEVDARNAAVVPLVINTQGWVKGLGMDLLVRIEEQAEVTDVFEFEAAASGEEWEDGGWEASIPLEGGWGRILAQGDAEGDADDLGFGGQSSKPGPRRHFLSPVGGTPLAARWTASDMRLLSLISYFHCRFPAAPASSSDPTVASASPLAQLWDFSAPLVAQRPWAVDWIKALKEIYLVGGGSEEISGALVWDALAIGLVALIAPDDDSPLADARPPAESVPYVQGRAPPDAASSRFVGFALVRATPGAAPPHDTTVHLLTPLPARVLPQATLLVKGETELPVLAMLDWRVDPDYGGGVGSVEREQVPFIEWVGKDGGAGVIGGGRRKVRRNVGRRQG